MAKEGHVVEAVLPSPIKIDAAHQHGVLGNCMCGGTLLFNFCTGFDLGQGLHRSDVPVAGVEHTTLVTFFALYAREHLCEIKIDRVHPKHFFYPWRQKVSVNTQVIARVQGVVLESFKVNDSIDQGWSFSNGSIFSSFLWIEKLSNFWVLQD